MKLPLRHRLDEAAATSGVPTTVILEFVKLEWIIPIDPEHQLFDEEDVARARLIWELRRDFGVNDEAVPLILHLIDQLNLLQYTTRVGDR